MIDDSFSPDFGTDFDPDTFVPDEEPEGDEEREQAEEIITEILGIYTNNLFSEIDAVKQANGDASEEEMNEAGNAFAEKESEALSGLIEIIQSDNSEESAPEEKIVESVDAVLSSNVCLNSVHEIEESFELADTIREATQDMSSDSKDQIQQSIESSLEDYRASAEYDAEKESRYEVLAGFFGITLTNAAPRS